jgi:hypothetical protein
MTDDIRWNDEARAKILEDSDRVLEEAVRDLGTTMAGSSWEDVFAELNARLKDKFIDFKPGPDLRKYAEAIAAGEYGDGGDGSAAPKLPEEDGAVGSGPEVPTSGDSSSDASGGSATTAGTSASGAAGSAQGNGAGDGEGAFAPDSEDGEPVVNDG